MIQRIPKAKKEAFNLVIKEYREKVDSTAKKAKRLEREGMLGTDVDAQYKKIAAASVYLNTVGLYCEMSAKSLEIMSMKNDAYLSNARKNTYQAIILLEKVLGTAIDSNLTETAEVLNQLPLMNPKRILNLLKKIEYCIALTEFEEGDNSKWKWNFVEMYGKTAVLSKNFTNFKDLAMKMYDPRAPFYQEINDLIQLVKTLVETAAKKFREKYELSTMDVQDMNRALDFMNLLVRIHIILNEQTFAQEAKKVIEKWKAKLEMDLKKKDEDAAKAKKKSMKKR